MNQLLQRNFWQMRRQINSINKGHVLKHSRLVWLGLFAALFLISPPPTAQAKRGKNVDLRDAMVKIYTVRNRPDFYSPWNMEGPRQASGSGVVIEGNRILTNAHVVSDQTFVQVRLNGSAEKHQARVIAVSHESDLALLTVNEADFFTNTLPVPFGDLPEVQEEVTVYGFPQGGDTLSTTTGVVSRIEHRPYVHASSYLLAAQLDAAINSGNSGGPVMKGDKIVGVAMQTVRGADGIGYMVPIPVVKHFLKDLEDGTHNGFPGLGASWQSMENPDLKAKYGLSRSDSGVLIIGVVPGTPAATVLKEKDVLVAIDGHPIAGDGTVEFRPTERTSFSYFIQSHQLGESISLTVLRDGIPQTLDVQLNTSMGHNQLVPSESYDVRPTYYIYGGMVFTKLTSNYLKVWGNNWYSAAPRHLTSLMEDNIPQRPGEEVVILLKVLASEVNDGYHGLSNWRISSVDGKPVLNMAEFVKILEKESSEKYITMASPDGSEIVLDRQRVEALQPAILQLYQLTSDRSKDLL